MNLSYKNRIALYYMIATAIVMALVFGVVIFVVQATVYANLDKALSFEAHKHTNEILFFGDSIAFDNMDEWEESEHREIQINPVFIQLLDKKGRLMDKSPNLKENALRFNNVESKAHENTFLENRAIRQVQIPVIQQGNSVGYIVAAMSLESSQMVLKKLRNVLFFSYLFVLFGLYFISRFLAGRSIAPIIQITDTTKLITKNNLDKRVGLPVNKDELHQLSAAINELLQRIENALTRERQFTSDASHELRTPLASLRGTLEVLIRKPRNQAEYEEKISYGLTEIDRMTATVEQLLLLARLESVDPKSNTKQVLLADLIGEIIQRQAKEIAAKKLHVVVESEKSENVFVAEYYANLILENIVSNAIKYSDEQSELAISISQDNGKTHCTVQDQGIGIRQEELENIFQAFYRSDALNHKQISGNGLGLSIAKKAADAISANISIESEVGRGTKITIAF